MARRLSTLGLVVTVLAALAGGCGDGDNDAGGATTTAAGAEAAELSVEDQTGDGTSVVVASVTLPAEGFIAVHADANGAPGPVIGHSALLEAGTSTDVDVPLDEALSGDATVWPMAHLDTNENGEYDFDPPASTEDGPATFANGDVAVVALAYTVQSGDASGGSVGADVTIGDFAFQTESVEVAAGSTVEWTNDDEVSHTVTNGEPEAPADAFDETVAPGASASVTFDEAGTFPYFCRFHPNMTAEVVVT